MNSSKHIKSVFLKSFTIILTLLFLAISSCNENSTNSQGDGYSVSGKLIYNGEPLPNATISLNKRIDLTTQSDANGDFSISNVASGEYSLDVEKTNPDGSFISKSSDISVNNDIVIESLILPKGVHLLAPSNVSATSMHLGWTSTDANDFREYKLYMHTTSGLDETTGTLIHVSTTIADTEFTVNDLNPLTNYFFRVYIMNDYGRLGGSNIVSSTSLNRNVLLNGSFEELQGNFPTSWSTWGTTGKFLTDSENSYEGGKSIKINLELNDWGVNSWGLYQQINPNGFEPGKNYKISFWCKTDTLEQYESISCRFTRNNYWDGNEVIASLNNFVEGPRSAVNWANYSFTLTIPFAIPSNYFITFDLIRAGTSGYTFDLPMNAWIDNVSIEKVQ